MSEQHRLITEFEVSMQENKLLIKYSERTNTICTKGQCSIEIDIDKLVGLTPDKRKEQIFCDIDSQILNQIANLLSHAGSKMVEENKLQ